MLENIAGMWTSTGSHCSLSGQIMLQFPLSHKQVDITNNRYLSKIFFRNLQDPLLEGFVRTG